MKLLIGADLVPNKHNEQLFINNDTKAIYGDVMNLAKNADRIIVNLECALTHHDGAIPKFGPNLKADPQCVNAIKGLGTTDVMLSNNHTFDFGIKGLRDTMAALDEAGIPYAGVGENDTDSRKPYFIKAEDKMIGIINVCEHEYSYALPNRMGANPFDPFLTMQDIREAKNFCDHLIVIYHGGKEYCRYPSPRLVNLCHEMVLCGADVVITQHSHCIGCYENFEGGHIVYGQGNFVFCSDTNEEEGWYTALLVELDIEKGIGISFYPIVSTATGCDLAKGEDAKKILADFAIRNEEMKNGKWRDGWHAFCTDPKRAHYHDRILNAATTERETQLFAHFLDCEAHTDVWRELYPTWNMTNELSED